MVLRRPSEPARQTGHLRTKTHLSGFRANQELTLKVVNEPNQKQVEEQNQ
jgi:hypothetical protein